MWVRFIIVFVVDIVVVIFYGPSMKWKWRFVTVGAVLGGMEFRVRSMA